MKYQEFQFFAGKYLPPFNEIFVQKIPTRPELFYLLTDFQNFCSTFCDKLIAPLCRTNISSRCKQLQNICEKPLSGVKKQTIDMLLKFSRWLPSNLAWPHEDPFCSIFLPLAIKIEINVDKSCSVMRQSWNYKE